MASNKLTARLRSKYPAVPAIVWSVAEADDNPRLVDKLESPDPFADPDDPDTEADVWVSVPQLADSDELGISKAGLSRIRSFLNLIQGFSANSPDERKYLEQDLNKLVESLDETDPGIVSEKGWTTTSPSAGGLSDPAVPEPTAPDAFPGIPLPWGNDGVGLQSRKQWCIELCCCDAFGRGSPAVVRLGAGMFEPFVHTDTGRFFLGAQYISKLTGWDLNDIKNWRKKLADHGWIVDTGDRNNRATVWEVRIPPCACGRHGIYQRPASKKRGSKAPLSK